MKRSYFHHSVDISVTKIRPAKPNVNTGEDKNCIQALSANASTFPPIFPYTSSIFHNLGMYLPIITSLFMTVSNIFRLIQTLRHYNLLFLAFNIARPWEFSPAASSGESENLNISKYTKTLKPKLFKLGFEQP